MAKEIERKFLVEDLSYRSMADSCHNIVQTYLAANPDATVRLRIVDGRGFITVKGRNSGSERDEWEYEIPEADAREMMERCSHTPVIDKTRYRVGRWEVDEYHGTLSGLIVAEIELSGADESVSLLPFVGKEVTGDCRYYNSALALSGRIPEDGGDSIRPRDSCIE